MVARRRNWGATRKRIYERDGGVCQVCTLPVEPRFYECGHIIDRCRGGSDEDDNLVVMCIVCNRFKDVHDTREAYDAWAKVPPLLAMARTLTTDEEAIQRMLPAQVQWARERLRGPA